MENLYDPFTFNLLINSQEFTTTFKHKRPDAGKAAGAIFFESKANCKIEGSTHDSTLKCEGGDVECQYDLKWDILEVSFFNCGLKYNYRNKQK